MNPMYRATFCKQTTEWQVTGACQRLHCHILPTSVPNLCYGPIGLFFLVSEQQVIVLMLCVLLLLARERGGRYREIQTHTRAPRPTCSHSPIHQPDRRCIPACLAGGSDGDGTPSSDTEKDNRRQTDIWTKLLVFRTYTLSCVCGDAPSAPSPLFLPVCTCIWWHITLFSLWLVYLGYTFIHMLPLIASNWRYKCYPHTCQMIPPWQLYRQYFNKLHQCHCRNIKLFNTHTHKRQLDVICGNMSMEVSL